MKQLFLIIGAPGSGKTTDASLIAKRNDSQIAHYSTGELLRDEVAKGTHLGQKIDSYISKGNLVPLDIVTDTIISAIKASSKDIVLIDGYPRSVEQMVALDEILLEEKKIKLVNVIEVHVGEDVAKDRVLGRARGADDNVEVFNNRMKIYNEPLAQIREFYTKKSLLHVISGENTIEEVVDEMEEYIKNNIK